MISESNSWLSRITSTSVDCIPIPSPRHICYVFCIYDVRDLRSSDVTSGSLALYKHVSSAAPRARQVVICGIAILARKWGKEGWESCIRAKLSSILKLMITKSWLTISPEVICKFLPFTDCFSMAHQLQQPARLLLMAAGVSSRNNVSIMRFKLRHFLSRIRETFHVERSRSHLQNEFQITLLPLYKNCWSSNNQQWNDLLWPTPW